MNLGLWVLHEIGDLIFNISNILLWTSRRKSSRNWWIHNSIVAKLKMHMLQYVNIKTSRKTSPCKISFRFVQVDSTFMNLCKPSRLCFGSFCLCFVVQCAWIKFVFAFEWSAKNSLFIFGGKFLEVHYYFQNLKCLKFCLSCHCSTTTTTKI